MDVVHKMRLAAALFAATVSAQSAAPSAYDATIATCATATPPSTALTVSQSTKNTAVVTYTGFTTAPSMLWVTNEEGTVVAFKNTGISSSTTLTWAENSPQPLSLRAHSCPPPADLTIPVRAWRGDYEDATAVCCAERKATTDEVSTYGPTITLDYNNLRFRVQATAYAPRLNFAKDDAGMILKADSPTSGAYSTYVPFSPLTASVMA